MSVKRLMVVGLGLIGGSIALAARRADPNIHVRGVTGSAASAGWALEHGVVDEAATADDAIAHGWFADGLTDLLIIGAPIPATIEWLHRLPELGYHGVVSDVASTKRAVVEAASAHEGEYLFVGGHPMAGSERSGVQAASAALFDSAYYILTPTGATDSHAYRLMHAFAASLGARVISIDAAVHDDAVAVVSHVPHVTAAALVELARSRADDAGADLMRLAAGGFKDSTRIAAGSPDLWTGICLDNAAAIVAGLAEIESILGEFRRVLEAGDADGVRHWLTGAADTRRALPAQWVPSTAQLSEFIVPVTDQPGAVGTVATALSRAGCNIENIEIDHQSEATAFLRLVLTDEGDMAGAISELEALGYKPVLRPLEGGDD